MTYRVTDNTSGPSCTIWFSQVPSAVDTLRRDIPNPFSSRSKSLLLVRPMGLGPKRKGSLCPSLDLGVTQKETDSPFSRSHLLTMEQDHFRIQVGKQSRIASETLRVSLFRSLRDGPPKRSGRGGGGSGGQERTTQKSRVELIVQDSSKEIGRTNTVWNKIKNYQDNMKTSRRKKVNTGNSVR